MGSRSQGGDEKDKAKEAVEVRINPNRCYWREEARISWLRSSLGLLPQDARTCTRAEF